jgi:hypothetical protein
MGLRTFEVCCLLRTTLETVFVLLREVTYIQLSTMAEGSSFYDNDVSTKTQNDIITRKVLTIPTMQLNNYASTSGAVSGAAGFGAAFFAIFFHPIPRLKINAPKAAPVVR